MTYLSGVTVETFTSLHSFISLAILSLKVAIIFLISYMQVLIVLGAPLSLVWFYHVITLKMNNAYVQFVT